MASIEGLLFNYTMNIDLEGFKRNCGHQLMGDLIIHNNRRMSESDTRKLVNYAIEQGYETLADVPDEVADKICDAYNKDFEKYDDTPDFYTLETIEDAIRRIDVPHYNWDVEDFISKLRDEL